jgi:Xaa-Pro aminopeptidase
MRAEVLLALAPLPELRYKDNMPQETGNIDRERLQRMRRAMESAQLDALVLRLPENVLLLSGFWPMLGATTLVFPREGTPACIAPQCYEAETEASLWEAKADYFRFGLLDSPDAASTVRAFLTNTAQGKNWKRIGYEANFGAIAPSWNSGEVLVPTEASRDLYRSAFGGSELVDVTSLLQTERRRKTAYEAAKLRIVSEISAIGMEAFERATAPGASGVELAAAVEHAIMAKGTGYKGAVRVRAYAQVATGPEETAVAYRPNEISTLRRMKDGDLAMLELGVVADGYWADRTRVRAAGRPTDEQLSVYEIVRRAQEAAISAIRPGVTGADVDEAARSVIRDAGYAEHFPHITGHGLGFVYHESSPMLAPGVTSRLEEGMLTSVEPGIYFKPMGGIRIEDDVLVTNNGAEVLGPFSKNLI